MNLLDFKIIDLTHNLNTEIPHWLLECGFKLDLTADYKPGEKAITQFRTHKISLHAGSGTHIDAPAHCIAGGKTIADLDLSDLIRPCVTIAIPCSAESIISLNDIMQFEKLHGEINAGEFVIIQTGWSQFWQDVTAYRNDLQYPTVSAAAANYLLERNIAGLGIDTLSPDNAKQGFPVHQLLLQADKYIVENIANAQRLPARGAYTFALPLKLDDCTESPLRLIALVPQ